MARDGFLDINSGQKSDLFGGDFYAADLGEEVSRGAVLDSHFSADLKSGKGLPVLGFEGDFESLTQSIDLKPGKTPLSRFASFNGTSRELQRGQPTGRFYVSAAGANELLQGLVDFFSSERDAVLEFKPEKRQVKAFVNAAHALLKLKVAFCLDDRERVTMCWSRKTGDAQAFVQTAQACSNYLAATTGTPVQLGEGLGGGAPGLGGLSPPQGFGLAPPMGLGGLAPPGGLLGFTPGPVLDVPACEPGDFTPILELAADPCCCDEGAQSLAKLLEGGDGRVCAEVLAARWELVLALLLSSACVLAAPAVVEKLLDLVDVDASRATELCGACASRLADEQTQLGRRQLARLFLRMLQLNSQVDVTAEIFQKLDATRARHVEDLPTQHYLSEAALALEPRRQLVC